MTPERILIVEDSPELRLNLMEMLNHHFTECEVLQADNGRTGIELAREFLPNLIISDIMMPIMDGAELLKALRSDPRTATIPLIFVTARADRDDHRAGMGAGADDYISKPFSADELIGAVHSRLRRKHDYEAEADARLDAVRENIITALPHEFRTPLNVVLGFSELLITDTDYLSDKKYVESMARHIFDGAQRLYRLIENYITYSNTEMYLLDRSRRESLKSALIMMPHYSIESYARERTALVEREEDLFLAVDPVEALPIYEEYFKKILVEIIDNAAKFSEKGTPIHVKAAVIENHYVITVSDRGRGIKEADLKHIGAFMQFERKLYEQQGSGLGLIIALRLTELHGGKLSVQSTEKYGTDIIIQLPICNSDGTVLMSLPNVKHDT